MDDDYTASKLLFLYLGDDSSVIAIQIEPSYLAEHAFKTRLADDDALVIVECCAISYCRHVILIERGDRSPSNGPNRIRLGWTR